MEITIELNRMQMMAHHGVMEQERKIGNLFEVTVHLTYPLSETPDDELENTINYADLADLVKREMEIPSRLLEHVAGRIKNAVSARWKTVSSGMVCVAKLTPPIPATSLQSAAVTLRW